MEQSKQEKPPVGTAGLVQTKAGEIFRLMGFDVAFDLTIAEHSIDLFIKKKQVFSSRDECWACFIHTANQVVEAEIVHDFYPIKEEVNEELERESALCNGCQLLIISEGGFSEGARKAATVYAIELKTLEELVSDLTNMYEVNKKLIETFEKVDQPY